MSDDLERILVRSMDDCSRKLLEESISEWKVIGQRVHKEIRESIVKKWFGKFNYTSLLNATTYSEPRTEYYGSGNYIKQAVITFESHINYSDYKSKSRAEAWKERAQVKADYFNEAMRNRDFREKHGVSKWKDINIPDMKPSNEYVLDLQLKKGIIGLPEKATVFANVPYHNDLNGNKIKGPWINKNFHKQTPLLEEIQSQSNWDSWGDKLRAAGVPITDAYMKGGR